MLSEEEIQEAYIKLQIMEYVIYNKPLVLWRCNEIYDEIAALIDRIPHEGELYNDCLEFFKVVQGARTRCLIGTPVT